MALARPVSNPITARVLIQRARAPAALEWVRALDRMGVRVYAADSLALPLTRFSRHLQGYFRLSEPRYQPAAWIESLAELVENQSIDWIIPTCEETFYLAWGAPRLKGLCRLFTSDFALLSQLHHKGEFAHMVQGWPLEAPVTQVVESAEQLSAYRHVSLNQVFKPAYSRFATCALIGPKPDLLGHLKPSRSQPWVVQERILGEEYCSYSLLREGVLLAHGTYHPRYRAGQGSGVYFDAIDVPAIERFVRAFGQATNYTGQVGFDWMRDQQQVFWVLECNPRATSGIHLFDDQPEALVSALADQPALDQPPFQPSDRARMVALAMLIFGGSNLLRREFWQDFFRARDVIHRERDSGPLLAQLPGIAEICRRAVGQGCGLLAASTADIEWDGQWLGAVPQTGTRQVEDPQSGATN